LIADLVYTLPYHSILRCRKQLNVFASLKNCKKRNREKIVQNIVKGFSNPLKNASVQISETPESIAEPLVRKCIYGGEWSEEDEDIRRAIDTLHCHWVSEMELFVVATSMFSNEWDDPRYLTSSAGPFVDTVVAVHRAISSTMEPKYRKMVFTRLRKFTNMKASPKAKSKQKLFESLRTIFRNQAAAASHRDDYDDVMTSGLELLIRGSLESTAPNSDNDEDERSADRILRDMESLTRSTKRCFDKSLTRLFARARETSLRGEKGPLSVLTDKVKASSPVKKVIGEARDDDATVTSDVFYVEPMKYRLRKALSSLNEEEIAQEEDDDDDVVDEDDSFDEEHRERYKADAAKNIARLLMKTGSTENVKDRDAYRPEPFVLRCTSVQRAHIQDAEDRESVVNHSRGRFDEDKGYDVVVENLPRDITEEEVRHAFSRCGDVTSFMPVVSSSDRAAPKSKRRRQGDTANPSMCGVLRFASESDQQRALHEHIRILGILVRDSMCYTTPPSEREIISVRNLSRTLDIPSIASEIGILMDTNVFCGSERLVGSSFANASSRTTPMRDNTMAIEDEDDQDHSYPLPPIFVSEFDAISRHWGDCLIEFDNALDALQAFGVLSQAKRLGNRRMRLHWESKGESYRE
tara:strand:- start:2938 stop:4848 length:1911 start_codon:yes stop_codon:yes gene_type:complete